MGGLGKTAISRDIAHQLIKRGLVEHLIWLDGAQTLVNAARQVALQWEINIEAEEWQGVFIERMGAVKQPSVIVIDNLLLSCIDTPLFRRLKACPTIMLANSRTQSELFQVSQEVDFLSEKDCVELFNNHTTYRDEEDSIRQIVALSGRHTLTIELLAKIGEASMMTAFDLLGEIGKTGFDLSQLPETPVYAEHRGVLDDDFRTQSIAQHIKKLFAISGLTEEQQRILSLIAKLPAEQYDGKKDLVPWLALESATNLVHVSRLGWLQRKGHRFSMHPVVATAMLLQKEPSDKELCEFAKAVLKDSTPAEGGHWCYQVRYLPILKSLYDVDDEILTVHLASCIANLHEAIAEYSEALPLYQRALEIRETALGKDHPHVASTLNNLAGLYQAMGNYDEALPLYQRALEIVEKALGKDHPHVASMLNNLAGLYEAMGNYDEALPLYQRDLVISEKALGKDHPDVATTLNNLAGLYEAMGNYDEALPLYQRALEIRETALGKDHPHVASTLNNLSGLYEAMGNYDEALPLYQRGLVISEKALSKDHPHVASTLNNLAGLYQAMVNYDEAKALYLRVQENE